MFCEQLLFIMTHLLTIPPLASPNALTSRSLDARGAPTGRIKYLCKLPVSKGCLQLSFLTLWL